MDTWIYLRISQHDMFYGQDNIKAIQKRQHQGKKKLKLFGHWSLLMIRQWLTPLRREKENGVTYEPIHVPSLFSSNQKDITQIKLSLLTFTTLFNHYFATATYCFNLFWSNSSTLKFWFIASLDVLWWNFLVWINFENGCAYPHEFVCVFSNMMCFMDEHTL